MNGSGNGTVNDGTEHGYHQKYRRPYCYWWRADTITGDDEDNHIQAQW